MAGKRLLWDGEKRKQLTLWVDERDFKTLTDVCSGTFLEHRTLCGKPGRRCATYHGARHVWLLLGHG